MTKTKLLFTFILFFQVFSSLAQIIPGIDANVDQMSDKELIELVKKAKESGLSDKQIEDLAATKGYTASDISKVKSRLAKLTTSSAMSTEADSSGKGLDSLLSKKKWKKYADLSPEEQKRMELRDKIYGLNFFNKDKANFQPNLKIPIPKNYIIGTDDELSVDISGYAFAHYSVKVRTDGTIKIENLSPILVSGLTVDQAKDKVIQRLKTLFGGLSSSGALTADLTIAKIRSIRVNVIGEAVFPGTYTVPSVATAFNLLYEAGGPTEIGSLRSIEIFRNGKVFKKLDFYEYLLKGGLKDNIVLQDQDILHIPYMNQSVVFNGQVRNPKIFELETGESFNTVLSYAGGFTELAYQKSVRIDRNTEVGKRIITLDNAEYSRFGLMKGDVIVVDSLKTRISNEVIIKGEVYMEGSFSIEKAPTIAKLIDLAQGLKPEAFGERILIKRKTDKFEDQILDFNYAEFKKGTGEDFLLKIYDSVLVSKRSSLLELRTIQTDGEVNVPSILPYAQNMTVSKAIMLSKGLKDGANVSRVEIARRIKKDDFTQDATVEIIELKIHPNLEESNLDNPFLLMPFDRIYIRKLSQYDMQKQISIAGEVVYPGPYTLEDKKERISDLIEKAGGLKNQADISSAKFTRNGKQVGVDITQILKDKSNVQNLLLIAGDVLEIPRKSETVSITGNVYNPVMVPYEQGINFREYLSLAGGSNDSGNVKKAYIKYGNGRLAMTKSFMGIKFYPKVYAGSEITVPFKPRKQELSAAERMSIFTGLTSISAVLITIARLILI